MSGTWTTLTSSAQYTSNGNYLDKTVDSSGKVTDYTYDANTGVLKSVKYPEDTDDTKTTYTYDSMYRIASATAKSSCGYTVSGALSTLGATYTYNADDLLSKIQTGSTTYNFTYGSFGLRTGVKVGTQPLASYVYTNDQNRYLNRLDYGNGDNVQYTYDNKGRVTSETYEDGSTVTYIYDNDGALAKVKDSGGAITYYYDLTGRLVKYTDSRSGTTQTVSHTYDTKNNLTKQTQSVKTAAGTVNRTAVYGYDGDNRLTDYTFGSSDLTYTYDAFNRLRVTTLNYNDSQILQKSLTYLILDNTIGTGYVSQHNVTAANYGMDLHYTYDDNGNILSVSDGTYTTTYEYDQANQLIRENNQAAGYTRVWAYDNSGNIENRRTYAYTTGEVDLFDYEDFVDYQYTNSNWGDLLTHYGDKVFSYDNIGNLLSDGSRTYTWKHGRQLATLSDGTTTWTYTYNSDGLRTKRTDGTKTYSYTYADGQLSYMIANGTDVFIAYDGLGQPLSINCNGATYFYVTNLQGDVVALLNSSGTAVVEYTYDAWGNILSCTGSMASTLGTLNPLRYRGYVYDNETGLYYLQSRYYDPEGGRFINADGQISGVGGEVLGYNQFAYCFNNPVNMTDATGNWPTWGQIFTAVATVAVAAVFVAAVAASAGAVGVAAGVAAASIGATGTMVSAAITVGTVGTYAVAAGIGACALSNAGEILTGTNVIRDKLMGGNQEAYNAVQTGLSLVGAGMVITAQTTQSPANNATKTAKPSHTTGIESPRKVSNPGGSYTQLDNKGNIYSYTQFDSFGRQSMRIDFQGRAHAGVLPHTHIYLYPAQGGRAEYIFDLNWNLIN